MKHFIDLTEKQRLEIKKRIDCVHLVASRDSFQFGTCRHEESKCVSDCPFINLTNESYFHCVSNLVDFCKHRVPTGGGWVVVINDVVVSRVLDYYGDAHDLGMNFKGINNNNYEVITVAAAIKRELLTLPLPYNPLDNIR